VRSSSIATSTSVPRALEHLALLRPVELLAGQREVEPQGDEPLLRAVVEVALDPPPLGVAGLEDARA
jgi:hypothetical protein